MRTDEEMSNDENILHIRISFGIGMLTIKGNEYYYCYYYIIIIIKY